jgi:hypothetical protein
MRINLYIIIIIPCLLILSACSNNIKNKIGVFNPPDEFMVETKNELKIPEKFELVQPKDYDDEHNHKSEVDQSNLSAGEKDLFDKFGTEENKDTQKVLKENKQKKKDSFLYDSIFSIF